MQIPPVFLINLDGSDDRLHAAAARLHAAGLEFERVAAFDGRGLATCDFPGYDGRAAHRLLGRDLQGAEIGCYLSHLDCARRFLASGARRVIVLEDDAQPCPGFVEGVEKALAWLGPQDRWDVIHLGAKRHRIYSRLHEFEAAGQRHCLTHAHYFPTNTSALIWSRRGAQGLVARHDRISAPIDIAIRSWQARAGRAMAVWPALATTSGAASDIDGSTHRRAGEEARLPRWLKKQHRLAGDKLAALRHKYRPGSRPGLPPR